jgi:hypothetical protein
MPPEPRFIVRFAAEPPQEGLPYGRWAEQLQAELLAACLRIDSEGDDLGQPGDITWFPDRTYGGRTYVPGTARTSTGYEVVGTWRGEHGNAAAMTLVWGVPMVRDGTIATAELADLAVDQCTLIEGRFTLLAPDDYRGDTLDVKLFDVRGNELARESLYEDDDEDDEPE